MFIIVGDDPTNKKKSIGTPLIDTPSWERLKMWLDFWGITRYMMLSDRQGYWYQKIKEQGANPRNTFICLGDKALAKVKRAKVQGKVVRVPHPSPDNKVLANKSYIQKMLVSTKEKLYDTGVNA